LFAHGAVDATAVKTPSSSLPHLIPDLFLPFWYWLTQVVLEKRPLNRFSSSSSNLGTQQNRLRWYGHMLRKEDNDWVKKCMEYEVEGLRPSGRPKRTWREVLE